MAAVACALPILPGHEENVRRLSEEVLASRELRDAYEESRWNLGIIREMAWLQPTPVGDMVIVYWESDDPQHVLREMAASQDQFDSRFRQFVQGSVPDMDPVSEQPLANKLLFEWQAV
ncbi:MAG TPA: hypothetical protein VK359_03045 [Rubrobacteraceae bacterium]|jgi:hypothetical protein|nr:hypothetical protein [Rubrobacteraceae bacterium]HLL56880.1 hypothetical protein [Rubrobacteraceae bacterium]